MTSFSPHRALSVCLGLAALIGLAGGLNWQGTYDEAAPHECASPTPPNGAPASIAPMRIRANVTRIIAANSATAPPRTRFMFPS